jgi:hypothetical protein
MEVKQGIKNVVDMVNRYMSVCLKKEKIGGLKGAELFDDG